MKLNYKLFLITVIVLIMQHIAFTQGCIAIHSTGSTGMSPTMDSVSSGWLLSSAIRYFKSFRHFSGTEEEKERIQHGTQVINYQFSWHHVGLLDGSKELPSLQYQSVTDKENSLFYNKYIRGDAAFADYVINVSLAYKL